MRCLPPTDRHTEHSAQRRASLNPTSRADAGALMVPRSTLRYPASWAARSADSLCRKAYVTHLEMTPRLARSALSSFHTSCHAPMFSPITLTPGRPLSIAIRLVLPVRPVEMTNTPVAHSSSTAAAQRPRKQQAASRSRSSRAGRCRDARRLPGLQDRRRPSRIAAEGSGRRTTPR